MAISLSKYRLRFFTILIVGLLIPAVSGAEPAADIPLPARMVIHQAQGLMEKEQFAKAIAVLEKFRQKGRGLEPGKADPKGYHHPMVCFFLGNCYLMLKNLTAASACYRAAVAAKPDFHAAWTNLAKTEYDLGRYRKAGFAFSKSYETNPEKQPETLYYAAVCFLTAKDADRCLPLFRQLLKRYQDAVKLEWKETMAQALLGFNRPREALPLIEELSEKTREEKRKQWQETRLHQYIALEMKSKALGYIRHLVREYPLEARWWKGLAHFHLRENDNRAALVALTIKGFIEPHSLREKQIVADLNMILDIPVVAVRFYENMFKESSDPDLIFRIAQGYTRLHLPEKALAWVEKGLTKKPSVRLLMMQGNILYELERFLKAAAVFETAARRKKNAGRAWLMAGYAAYNAEEPGRARRAFKQAALFPEEKEAAQTVLQRLARETVLDTEKKGG